MARKCDFIKERKRPIISAKLGNRFIKISLNESYLSGRGYADTVRFYSRTLEEYYREREREREI